MFCTNCGMQIDDDSNFCTYCGKEVRKSSSIVDAHENEVVQSKISPTAPEEQIKESVPVNIEEPSGQQIFDSTKYDETYEKDTTPTVVGCLLLFIWLIVYLSNWNKQYQSYAEYEQALKTKDLLTKFDLLLRVVITIWVVNIARFRNREGWPWGILAFLFPTITLIIIGQKKKLKSKQKVEA